jgi:hypothetical protein
MNCRPDTPAIYPYSRPNALARLDGRTKEARLLKRARAELLAFVGGKPSMTQAALIEQLAQLKLRIATMDRKFAAAGATMTDHDQRCYLAWCNTFGRMLSRLGMQAAPPKQTNLADYLSAKPAAPPASEAQTRVAVPPHDPPAPPPSPAVAPPGGR